MTRADEIRGNEAAAAYVGVAVATWRAYVARGQAPKPDRRPLPLRGHALPVWKQATLDAWKASRPGRGRKRERPE